MYIIVETKDGKAHKFPYAEEFLKYPVSNHGGHLFIHSPEHGQEHNKIYKHEELKIVSIFFED